MFLKLNLRMNIYLNSMMAKNNFVIAVLFCDFQSKENSSPTDCALIQTGFYTAMIPDGINIRKLYHSVGMKSV